MITLTNTLTQTHRIEKTQELSHGMNFNKLREKNESEKTFNLAVIVE